jgi:hypothetical protein
MSYYPRKRREVSDILVSPEMNHSEFEAAVTRFDGDLIVAASASHAALDVNYLRRRAVTAYRNALNVAAGHPFDPRWRLLTLIVDAFIIRVGCGPHTPDAEAALERLALLRNDGRSPLTRAPARLAKADFPVSRVIAGLRADCGLLQVRRTIERSK